MLGIKATEDALESFNNMKLGKKIAFIIFVVDGSDIKVEDEQKKEDVGDDYLDSYLEAVKKSGRNFYA